MPTLYKKKNERTHFLERNKFGLTENGETKHKKPIYNRYGSKTQTFNGIDFDSTLEVNIYKHFLLFKDQKLIKDILPHPAGMELIPAQYRDDTFNELKGKKKDGKICVYQSVVYNPDFKLILKSGKEVYIDTKSIPTVTDSFVIKMKLLYQVHGHSLCILMKELIPYLPSIIKDLEKGRIINPTTKPQLKKLIDRYLVS